MNGARVQLWWLPVGAGGHVVVHTSRWWESFHAFRGHRAPQPLFHSALIVLLDGARRRPAGPGVRAATAPVEFRLSPAAGAALLERTAHVPRHVWGRRVPGSAKMWNSNSLVSWLLEGAGIDAGDLHPPHGGSAPGWAAGIAAARA